MNTLTNAYERKLSSGLVASLLVLSALSIVPIVISPTHAANAAFTSTFYYPYATVGTSGDVRSIKITNPLGNSGVTEVDLNFPAGSAATGGVTAGAFYSGFVNTGTVAVAGAGPWTILYQGSSSTAVILPAGAAGVIDFTFTPETAEATAGVVDSFTLTLTVRFADGSTQTTTYTLYEGRLGSVNTITTTSAVTTATAGTSFTYTATLGAKDSGLPLSWSSSPSVATEEADGFSASFGTSTFTTGSGLTYTSTFVSTGATATEGTYTATVNAGKTGAPNAGGMITTAFSGTAITITAAGPTQVTIGTPLDVAGKTPTYISSVAAQTLTVSLADTYGNAVTSETGTVTLSALAGTISHKYLGISSGTANMTITYTGKAPGATNPLVYGTFDLISASLVVTAPSSITGTYSGTSKQLSIGCLASNCATPPTPTVTYYDPSGTPVAGSTIGLSLTLTTQKSVPVNFTLATDSGSANPYAGTFANGKSWIVVYTSSAGVAAANFTADTRAGDAADAGATVNAPTTASPSRTYSATPTGAITSVAAAGTKLKVLTYSNTGLTTANSYVKPSGYLYLNVKLQDAYGNTVPWGSGFALQIALAVSAGGLSATTVYINSGKTDTSGSGYQVQFTAPATLGDVTITASTSQPSISSGTKTVHVVSINPSVSLTPVAKTALSKNSVLVNATGIPSLAASAGTVVVNFKYSLNGAANLTAGITSTNSSGASFTSFSVTFLNGTNTLKIFATDSNGKVGGASFTFTVSPPTPSPTQFTSTGATSTKSGGFTGAGATFTNTGAAKTVNVYFVWYNSANQIVSVGAQLNVAFAAGGSATFFNSYNVPGTYTVQVFIQDTSGNAASTSYSVTITI